VVVITEGTARAARLGVAAFILLSARAAWAEDACEEPEVLSGGFCCPRGSTFDRAKGACVGPGALEEGAKTMELELAPAVTFDDGASPSVSLFVNGSPPRAGSTFDVDVSATAVRVDVVADGYAPVHFTLPIVPRVAHQVVAVRQHLARKPNFSVSLVDPARRHQGTVVLDCVATKGPAVPPPACVLDGPMSTRDDEKTTTCRFVIDTARCPTVRVTISGTFNTTIPELNVASARFARINVPPSTTRPGWVVVPIVLSVGAIATGVAAALVKDETATHALVATSAITTTADFLLGGLAIAAIWPGTNVIVETNDPAYRRTTPATFAAAPPKPRALRLGLGGLSVTW